MHWRPSERPNYQWGILCQLAEAAVKGNEVKQPGKLTKEVLFHQGQCSCTQVCGCNGCCAWLWLWTGWSPSILWFGPIWLFSVPQHEKKKTLGWEAVSDRWWGHICRWILFWGSGWELLYHGNPSTATLMEEVCGPQRRLDQIRPLHHSQPLNFSAHNRIWPIVTHYGALLVNDKMLQITIRLHFGFLNARRVLSIDLLVVYLLGGGGGERMLCSTNGAIPPPPPPPPMNINSCIFTVTSRGVNQMQT